MKGTKDMIDLPENIYDLLEEANEKFAGLLDRNSQIDWDLIEKSQPSNFSWVTVDVSRGHIATDTSTGIAYQDNSEFKDELLKLLDSYFSDEIISLYREGSLTELKLIIGSVTADGRDLNEDLGEDYKPNYKQK